ncbi:MAG: AMP-binding protein [Clostridia bacterium]|nr:AMP-binding protein [Clostridia bacterium]
MVFSTEQVSLPSFLALCVFASDYGYSGFEISDPFAERTAHRDSVLRSSASQDSKRKLRNRGLSVSALRSAIPIERMGEGDMCSLIDLAVISGTERIILHSDGDDVGTVAAILSTATRKAEKDGVDILVETVGFFSDTKRLLELFSAVSSPCMGASWNTVATCFTAGETPDETINNLGAYISYVRLGDYSASEKKRVIIGDGDIPVERIFMALSSLNYGGFICSDSNEDISDPDIVLTHFSRYVRPFEDRRKSFDLYTNRAGTGTFPWQKFGLVDLTFPEVLDKLVELYPDKIAFKYTTLDYTRTYAEFARDVDRAAAAFIALGVKPGYHVAVWATNVPEWFITFWAAVKIGAVLVTVNTAYKIHEIEYLLHQSDTHTLVMISGTKDTDYREIITGLCPMLSEHDPNEPLYTERLPFLRHIVTAGCHLDGCLEWEEMLSLSERVPMGEVRRRAAAVRPDDVCNMQYTSGTTGFPKGVMLTHRNIVNDGKIIGDRLDLSTADRMMVQVPMFHCFGMVLTMTSTMTHGGTLCPLPYFSPKSSLSCITNEKITCFNGVPTMFIAMFNHEDFAKTDFSYMRTGIMAGSNCPPELMKRAAAEMNMREILSVYGQTEAAPGCTMGEVDESLELRTETVGSAFPNVECRIIDPETGKELPDGTDGEFVARGFNIMKGYYKMPDATRKAVDKDGWLHSGDICRRTPEGYYLVTGRLKDMIIRGGENIYPREIEEFYLKDPHVRDIQVVGVKDASYGEEACAWVILHESNSVDADYLRKTGLRSMARHKVPKYFIFVDEFPMNAAGKILKYKMREESEKILGL